MSDFDYLATPGRLVNLQGGLSVNRAARYVALANGDLEGGLRLYAWNSAMAESLYTPLQSLEVLTRNRFHDRLTARSGSTWYDTIGLAHGLQNKLVDAKSKLRQAKKVVTPPSVVSELSFGFWVGLLGPGYLNDAWHRDLLKLFQSRFGQNSRKQIHNDYISLRDLRNRVAHHECIIHSGLPNQHRLILSLMKTLCPDTAAWAAHSSKFDSRWSDPANPWLPTPIAAASLAPFLLDRYPQMLKRRRRTRGA